MPTCRTCNEEQPLEAFYRRADKYTPSECKSCCKKRVMAQYEKNKDQINSRIRATRAAEPDRFKQYDKNSYYRNRDKKLKRSKDYRQDHPDRVLNGVLKVRYGISLEDYKAKLEAQGGVCAICKGPSGKKRYNVDHNHKSGKTRGLLCGHCNTMIGLARENIEFLKAAISYLQQYEK